MKHYFLLILFICAPVLLAQESTKASAPVIVAKIPLGETLIFEGTAISFSKVVEDSRCPTDVTCIWAGEAKIIATIKTESETIEKQLLFQGTSFGKEEENTLFISDSKKYIGYRLSPYPKTSLPITQRNYYLDVLILN